uniref:ORF16 n=1 Tax=Kallithea virus TaxID=1654582 RepID=A0A0F7KIY7_9VIRU|nr:ORF16 [Kallithea virus]
MVTVYSETEARFITFDRSVKRPTLGPTMSCNFLHNKLLPTSPCPWNTINFFLIFTGMYVRPMDDNIFEIVSGIKLADIEMLIHSSIKRDSKSDRLSPNTIDRARSKFSRIVSILVLFEMPLYAGCIFFGCNGTLMLNASLNSEYDKHLEIQVVKSTTNKQVFLSK